MNEIRIAFLRALAQITRLDFLKESPRQPFAYFWLVVVRACLGVAYAFVAAFLFWLLRSPILAGILATIALLVLHHYLTSTPEATAPTQFRKALFPGENPTADLLANLVVPLLLMLFILGGHAFWLPAILALGTAAGIQFTHNAMTAADSQQHSTDRKSWIAAVIALAVFALLPCCGNSDALRAAFLRAFFLLAGMFFGTQWLASSKLKTTSFHANCLLGTAMALLLALIANAL